MSFKRVELIVYIYLFCKNNINFKQKQTSFLYILINYIENLKIQKTNKFLNVYLIPNYIKKCYYNSITINLCNFLFKIMIKNIKIKIIQNIFYIFIIRYIII